MTSQAELSTLGETLIPIIDKLQQILHGVRVDCLSTVEHIPISSGIDWLVQAHLPEEWKIQLPEVAVVGSQSSGKSSVLESLVRSLLQLKPAPVRSVATRSSKAVNSYLVLVVSLLSVHVRHLFRLEGTFFHEALASAREGHCC